MGFDKLLNFLIKNLNYDTIENININSNIRKIIVNHIMFDISFLIYQNLIEIENEINNIIKIILALPFNFNNTKIQERISEILLLNHWSWFTFDFDGINEEEIINNFLKKISYDKIDNYIIIDKIIIIKIFNKIIDYIDKIHNIDLLKSINIIFDGIPSFSKILEQRRRRIRNYLETCERKNRFEKYFNIDNTFQDHNDVTYDYFKWLKLRFTIDKSFGPTSLLIKNLEIYLYENLKLKYNNILIFISNGHINGEADYKIFKTIYNNKYSGDISIHTIDSDLIHEILVQQNYYNIKNIDLNVSVIKYNLKNNQIQYINAQNIITNIEKIYIEKNGNYFNNYIIYDLCLIFLFFGNDHLPSSFEIGPELSLEYYLKIHSTVFKNNNYIITLVDDKINFSFENFCIFLKEIYKKIDLNKTKIIIGRYFKINYNITTFLIDKLELNFEKILLLSKKLLFDNGKNNNDLDEDDLRYKLIQKYDNLQFPFDYNNLSHTTKNECTQVLDKLLTILDISDTENNFCGLPIYIKTFSLITNNNYQNLYLNFIENISIELEKQYPIIYDYFDINNVLNNAVSDNNLDMIKSYIKKIYHLVITLFGNMANYNSNNFTYYKYYLTPYINDIVFFLENNNDLNDNYNKEIDDETVSTDNYLNSINHYIIITPFLKDITREKYSVEFYFLIKKINLTNFWFENNNFQHKDFDINELLKEWFNALLTLNNKLEIELQPFIII